MAPPALPQQLKAARLSGTDLGSIVPTTFGDVETALAGILGFDLDVNFTTSSTLDIRGILQASAAKMIVKDVSGTWGTAIPEIEFHDSAATIGGGIRFTTGQDIIIENLLSGQNIEINITGAGQVDVNSNFRVQSTGPSLFLKDTDSTGTAAVASVIYKQSDDANIGLIGFSSAADGNLEITNNISGGNIELTPTAASVIIAGNTNIETNDAALILKDTTGTGTGSVQRLLLRDSADTDVARFGMFSASDGNLEITNLITNANIEFGLTGSGGLIDLRGDVRIFANDAPLVIQDDTGVGNAALARVIMRDSAATDLGRVGFFSATDGDLEFTNLASGGDLIFATTAGEFISTSRINIENGDPRLRLKDTSSTGSALTARIEIVDSADALAAAIGYTDSGNSHLEMSNFLSGGDIELRASNFVRVFSDLYAQGTNANIVCADTSGVWGTAIPSFELFDSAFTAGAKLRMDTSEDLILENLRSNADIKLSAAGSGILIFENATPVFSLIDDDALTDAAVQAVCYFGRSGSTQLGRVGYISSGDTDFTINNTIGTGDIILSEGGALNTKVNIGRRLDVGSPTSPQDAAGVINAQAVYDDGVLLTCYPFEREYATMNLREWDDLSHSGIHEPARRFAARTDTDILEFKSTIRDRKALPAFPTKDEWILQEKLSAGDSIQRLIETSEVLAIHICKLHDRLEQLEQQ